MRILFFSDYFGKPTTTFIYNQFIELNKLPNVEAIYICTEKVENTNINFSNVLEIPFQQNVLLKKLLWELEQNQFTIQHRFVQSFKEKLNNVIKEFKPDIIHCHFGNEAIKLIQNISLKVVPFKLVIHFHGYDASYHLSNKAYLAFYRSLLKEVKVDLIFCCGFLKENFIRRINCEFHSHILFYGATNQFISNHSSITKESETVKLLQVGHLEERKGQEISIKAFHKFLRKTKLKNIELTIAGGGPDLVHLQSLAEELGISEKVKFTNWISPDKVLNYLLESDYFLHPSLTINNCTEGLPNAIIEALSIGLPVIATNHAGIPDIIENEVNGLLVDEFDVEGLSLAIERIINWPNRLEVNKEKAKTKFSIEKNISELLGIYEKVLNV